MKKMVSVVVVGLILVLAVTAYLNKGAVAQKERMQEKAQVIVKANGAEVKTLDMETIQGLGEKGFEANLKTNGKEAEKHTYTGVSLSRILNECDIKVDVDNQVIAKAIDGYTVALTGAEVLEEDNVYLAYKMDGKLLGKKEDGGKGPYQVIIRKDQFSQRWCKFVVELDVQ
ncbi:MAG: molybdopterin-dependent oxidoreductase [Bacillota bacterium]